MEKDKIIIAASSKATIAALKQLLETSLFSIARESASGNEVLRQINLLPPDIVITDYILSDMTGLDLAKNIENARICPVVILANNTQNSYIDELKNNVLDIFCITKPINGFILNHTVSLAIKFAKKIYKYESDINDLKQKLENRKIIEKAKGILMQKFDLSENGAYAEMRKKSMDLAKPIEQIAKNIVDMFKTFEQ